MERRLTPRGRERRAQLMRYAAERFARNGYHPTSVAEVVEGLGVGKGVFYWYFGSKDELFREVLAEAQLELRRAQRRAIGDEPDPVRRIELGIRESMAWFEAHRDLFNLFQFAATDERFAPLLRRGQEVAFDDALRHVKEGIAEGRIRDGDPEALTHAVLGVTSHLTRALIRDRNEPAAEVADVAVAFCLHGLLGTSSRA
jgi:TetR/AcrR family transcriptional regulator, cholesterol catabolism regulator